MVHVVTGRAKALRIACAIAGNRLAIRQKNTDEIVDVSNDLHEYLLQKDQS